MKCYTIVVATLLMAGCCRSKEAPQQQEVCDQQRHTSLKKSGLPLEVRVNHLSELIRTDDKAQLVYELNVTNNFEAPLDLQRVEIYNLADAKGPIAVYDPTYLRENFERPGLDDYTSVVDANQFGVLNLSLYLDTALLPARIFHKLHFRVTQKDGTATIYPIETTIVNIPEMASLKLGLPFAQRGRWLYEAEGHKNSRFFTEGNATYPQRFALDWIFVSEDGTFAKGDPCVNGNWYGYGLALIAVADGVVVAVKDSIKENVPLADEMAVRITRETIGGNYVMLDIGEGMYAFYGHLIPGSLTVAVGEQVRRGQVIGSLGNSGNSDLPHLHFHLESKGNASFGGEGLPYHLTNFTHLRSYTAQEVFEMYQNNLVTLDGLQPTHRSNEFPAGYGIVEIK